MRFVHLLEHLDDVGLEVELRILQHSQRVQLQSQGGLPNHELRRVGPVQTVHAVHAYHAGLVPPRGLRVVESPAQCLPVRMGPHSIAGELRATVEETVLPQSPPRKGLQQVDDAPVLRPGYARHIAVQVVHAEIRREKLVQIADL